MLCEAYTEDKVPDAKGNEETRIVMQFHPRLAPIKAAIFPLVNKDGMPEKAMELYRELKPHFNVVYDDTGAVGRRYRRQDEAGTPFCITIDGDTMKDDTVTIRDRDTLQAGADSDDARCGRGSRRRCRRAARSRPQSESNREPSIEQPAPRSCGAASTGITQPISRRPSACTSPGSAWS